MALHLSQEELESVSASSYKILEGSRNQVQTLYLNHAQEPFDNDMVCQAIGYAVDVDGILSLAGESAGTKAGGPSIPPWPSIMRRSWRRRVPRTWKGQGTAGRGRV